MSAQFTTTRRIQFSDTDMAGIVHFSNFYRFMEDAEHEFLRSLGLSVMQTQADGTVIGWPRVQAQCTFEAPAFFEDVIEIRLNVARKSAKSLTFEVEFYRSERRLAHGTMKTVCCLIDHGKPLKSVKIPPEIVAKIPDPRR